MSETKTPTNVPATTNNDQMKAMLARGPDVPLGGKSPPPPPPGKAYIGARNQWTSDATLEKLEAAGVEPDSFYVSDAAGILSPQPFQIYVLQLSRFMSKSDKSGAAVDLILPPATKGDNDARFADGYRPNVLGLAVVVLPAANETDPDGFLPATFTFKSAAVKAFEKIAAQTTKGGAAFDAEQWAKRSARHAAGKSLWPTFRAYGTIWGESGDVFQTFAQIEPTPAKNVPAIQKLCGDEFGEKLAPIFAAYGRRVSEWERYAKLTPDQKKQEKKIPF